MVYKSDAEEKYQVYRLGVIIECKIHIRADLQKQEKQAPGFLIEFNYDETETDLQVVSILRNIGMKGFRTGKAYKQVHCPAEMSGAGT